MNNNRLGKQYKAFECSVKEYNEESRTISGYASVFGNIDKDGDMLVRGCFAKSIADRGPGSNAKDKILLLWQHDMHEPIGRIKTLVEDEHGLYFEAEIDDIELGNRAIAQLKSGTLNQFSIGFQYISGKWEMLNDEEYYRVTEVKLFEISVVSIGANGETEFLGMKSEGDMEKARTAYDAEVKAFCKELPFKQQDVFLTLLSKGVALSSVEPSRRSLDAEKADTKQTKAEKINVFENIKVL